MSDYNTDAGYGLRTGLGRNPEPVVKPTDDELFGAAFRTQNSMGSVINYMNRGSFAPVPGYNPVDDLKSWADDEHIRMHGSAYLGSQSPAETLSIKTDIDKRKKDNQMLAAGGWSGTLAGIAMGSVDPTMFLPLGNAAKLAEASLALRTADVATSVGKMALMQSTAQEVLLSATQPDRTLKESAINVGASTLLGAMLGAGGYALLARDGLAAKGMESLDAGRVKLSEHNGTLEKPAAATSEATAAKDATAPIEPTPANANEPAPREAASVGAATSDTRDLSPVPYGLDSIPGVGKAVSKMFPNLDALTNGTKATKAAVTELSEVPIALKANQVGQTATRYGGPAIDREIKTIRDGLHPLADLEIMDQWGQHLAQPGGPTFMQRQTGRAPAGKMTFDEFDAAVYDALSTGDAHPDPHVTATAQWFRREGFDPIKERARAIDGFDETVSRPGETYAPRIWNKELIGAKWNDFVDTWTNHLEGQQAVKARAQEKIGLYHGALESHRSTIDKLEGKIAKLETDADVIAARHEETTSINKAANRRSEKLRESQYRNEGGIRVDVPGKGIENARGGSLFETLARNRGNLLADRASAKLSEIEKLQGHLAEEIQSHDAMRAKIEAEVAAWEGNTAKEAKAALKARAEAEKARETAKASGTYKGKDERLSSADKAVDSAVKKILESERTLDRQELKGRAEEIAGRMLGTPDGRLPYDAAESKGPTFAGGDETRGHTAHREIDIPYEMAKPWLDRSATKALKSYTHSVLPDAIIAERFNGDPAMTSVMKEIESEYAAKRAEAGAGEKKLTALKNQMDNDIRIVAGIRDRIRGTYANDPQMRSLARFSQNALKVNNIISSHGMAVSSLPDFAGVAFRHGMESAFKDAWLPFLNSMMDNEAWQAVKKAGDEWKAYGIGIETVSASRNHALSDIAENYRPASKVERALSWASDKAFIANLLAPLTDVQKRMAANAVAHNILRSAQAVAEGKATAKQIQRLAEGNITEAQAVRIHENFTNNGGENVKGILLPNTESWSEEARRVFVGAVSRDVDIAVVQPGQEKPFFMSKPGWNVLGQYKAFTISATQRILIANLQRHDAGSMAGIVTALGMGMLSYRINTLANNQKASDRPQDWIKEGISRGGILGVLDDANSLASKATGGKADIHRLYGADKPLSKYVSRDAASMFLGPTYGKVQQLMQISRAATSPSGWTESDTHALRMGTLGTNFPYMPRLFNSIEEGANNAFGIPMKAKPQ